jgi:hypothetical protein
VCGELYLLSARIHRLTAGVNNQRHRL